MKRNTTMKRIAGILHAVMLVLQISPMGAENDSSGQQTTYSNWWSPDYTKATAEYTFKGVGDSVLLPYFLATNGIYGMITDATIDSEAVQLESNLYLTAVNYFESATLTVTISSK